MISNLNNSPSLVLNADYQPLSYFPLSLWNWQDTIKAVFLERVNIIAEYDYNVNSASLSIKLPSVIALKKYIPINKTIPFTRFNLFLRDKFKCQYCDTNLVASELTFDHVRSRARGGVSDWVNVVSACYKCNNKKGSLSCKEAGMFPIKHPKKPTTNELRKISKSFPPNYLHYSWNDFLYWDAELESE